jgi:putative Holliday junction resolvase
MNLLGLDIGKRRTGVAFLDARTGIPLPLSTIEHTSEDGLLSQVHSYVREKTIGKVIIGLPRLPSGKEGEQAEYVRSVAEKIRAFGVDIQFIDERYTSPRRGTSISYDGDAAAACEILSSIKKAE